MTPLTEHFKNYQSGADGTILKVRKRNEHSLPTLAKKENAYRTSNLVDHRFDGAGLSRKRFQHSLLQRSSRENLGKRA